MPKTVPEDRPIWPVAPTEDPPREAADRPDAEAEPAAEAVAPQSQGAVDSFAGFGSFSG